MKREVVLITGSSTGFGRLTAEKLALSGHWVFASMRGITGKNAEHAATLKNWAADNNVKLEVIDLDVTSDESVNKATNLILEKTGGRIDVIVNNAGIYGGGIQEAFTVEDYKAMFDVNVFGPARVNNAFLPTLRKQGSGLIIQISSVLGRFVIPFGGLYDATKYAVEALTENLAYEVKPLGIDVAIVQPGAFATEITQKPFAASNAKVIGEYGRTTELLQQFGQTFGAMLSDPNLPNQPHQVADAIAGLISRPTGEVPLRTVVDALMFDAVNAINQTSAMVQQGILTNFGLTDLAVEQLEAKAV